jgi:soluble lytic murein transglycosylase-like protein
MKIILFAVCICACLFAVHAVQVLTTSRPLRPLSALPHIRAPRFTLDQIIHAASRKYQMKASLIRSIIAAESAFSPTVVSPKGAVGLMQLMPETAHQFGADPNIPAQNVDAGARYLRWLLQRYANKRDPLRRAIAAYNAGPGAVERFRGVPPYRETRIYVAHVLKLFRRYQNEDSRGLARSAVELSQLL